MLSGYKTHIVAAVFAAVSILSALGVDIPGVPPDPDWLAHLLTAFGLSTLRAGIAANGK